MGLEEISARTEEFRDFEYTVRVVQSTPDYTPGHQREVIAEAESTEIQWVRDARDLDPSSIFWWRDPDPIPVEDHVSLVEEKMKGRIAMISE
jgi:hypothetical protein